MAAQLPVYRERPAVIAMPSDFPSLAKLKAQVADLEAQLVKARLRLSQEVTRLTRELHIERLSKPLTEREAEVYATLMQGDRIPGNKEMAARLNVTERTIKFHISALLVKFDVKDRYQLRGMS